MTHPTPSSATSSTGVSPVVWAAIPCFNNAATIFDIAQRTLQQLPNVLVIDDGSTDADLRELLKPLPLYLLSYSPNEGKGAALQSAFTFARDHGATHLITLDADGQHFPEDIPNFLPHLNPTTILIGHRTILTGHRPTSSTFGQNFSDFWIHLETGQSPRDTQSGFRAYPLAPISQLQLRTSHYNFEVEIITRALWAGLATRSIPIRVFYPEPQNRISSFRPFKDNLRLSLLHTRLILRQLLPLPHRKITSPPPINPINSINSINSSLTVFLTLLLAIAQFPWGILVLLYLALRLHFPKLITLLSLTAASTFMLLTPALPTALGHALLGPNISPFAAHFTGAHALAFPIALTSAILVYVCTPRTTRGATGLRSSQTRAD